jgi:tetratricopeptide (TPR) repeat protein
MQAVWPDSFVEEVNVARSVHQLRKILAQDKNGNRFIETIPTKGYRFAIPVVACGSDKRALTKTSHDDSAASEPPGYSEGVTQNDPEKKSNSALISQRLPSPEPLQRHVLVFGLITTALILGVFWFSGIALRRNAGTTGQAPPTGNSGAYRLYLEGKFVLDRRHKNSGSEALPKFEEAIKLDPGFALAYAGKADAEWRIFYGLGRTHDEIARARASINKALSLDPDSSYAHTILCRVNATYDWDFHAAEKACRRAVETDPRNYDARHELAMLLTQFARHDEALAEIDTAVALAPTSYHRTNRSLILFHAKRYREAIDQLEQVRSSDPEFSEGVGWLWQYYALDRNFGKALESYISWEKQRGRPVAEDELKEAYSMHGWRGVQRAIAAKYIPGDRGGTLAAALHCQLGDKDKVFEFLEGDLKHRAIWMIHLIADPRFDPCRDDPRFVDVLKRVGLIQ